MTYAYIRVSTKQQKIDRQLEVIKDMNIDKKQIFIDKESGKDFCRQNYTKLIKMLKKGDLLVIKSIDRLGRNYQMIIEEWAYITKTVGADVLVLDMPLLDTRTTDDNLLGKFISDIVLQILSFVAENERTNIKERQAEGIKAAKAKGVKFGRPKANLPPNYETVIDCYLKKRITAQNAMQSIGISRGTYYRLVKQYRNAKLG